MATWQLTAHLIPRQKLQEIFTHIPLCLDFQALDEYEWWENNSLPNEYEDYLSSFLNQASSWNPKSKIWGQEDSNLVKLNFENEKVSEVVIRFDLGNLSNEFLVNVCRFVDNCKCLILTEEMQLIEPNLILLKEKLKSSKAFRFTKDPELFFKELHRNSNENGL